MKSDARVRYTKLVIKNSFVDLLKSKPLAKITVKEICDRAEINRATFYKYYSDPYDLLDTIEQDFLKELQDSIGRSTQGGFKATFTFILERIKADAEGYQTLFSENGDPHFPARLISACYKKYADVEEDKAFQKLDMRKRTWLFYFVAQGCSGILDQWMAGGMEEPIGEVADFADQLMKNTLRAIE